MGKRFGGIMITYTNFTQYTPAFNPFGMPAMFLKSTEGVDWYECQSHFRPETLKIQYDDKGIIDQACFDVSRLVPVNYSVSEVHFTGNEDDAIGMYFDGKSIMKYVEPDDVKLVRLRQELKDAKLSAVQDLTHLKMVIDVEVATKEEKKLFTTLKKYVIMLSEISDCNLLEEGFTIPTKPE